MKSPRKWWDIDSPRPHVYRLRARYSRAGECRRIALLSDLHWDNASCQLDSLARVLDEANEGEIPVFCFGDFFCAMQGKWDPRSSEGALRPEHRGANYLDRLVETAVDWFRPYKDVLALVSPGNHETSIRKRHETCLTSRFVGGMRATGSPVLQGGYWGFILYSLMIGKRAEARDCKVIHYHHGAGGGGEITRGMIDNSRTRSMYSADVYVSGHIHRRNFDENTLIRLTHRGNIEHQQQLFLRSSCWKDEMSSEWHAGEKGRGARPIGGWWLDLYVDSGGASWNYHISKMIPILM